MYKTTRWSVTTVFFAAALCAPLAAWAQDEPALDSLRRSTPSGQYVDPASFFRFHGYTTLSYTQNGAGVGQESGATPQILVNGLSPRTGENESGFRNDAALFVGGEPFDGVGSVIEIHFVGNSLDPVLTEAKFMYELAASDRHEVTLSGGRFWWPFGIHNGEWFSSVNSFPVVSPAAAEVVPAHYNEVGVMIEGVSRIGSQWGLNYVGALGNGVPGFELMPNVRGTSSDANADRSVTGRLALARGGPLGLEVGLSAAAGGLRDGEDTATPIDQASRYEASFAAYGSDLSVSWGNLTASGYYYSSSEDLVGAPLSQLSRSGFTVESSFHFPVTDNPRLQGVSLHARAGRAEEDTVTGALYRRTQLAGGLTLQLTRAFGAEFAYVVQKEGLDTPQLANNILSFSLTAEF